MFYSERLLGRNGRLREAWKAAFFDGDCTTRQARIGDLCDDLSTAIQSTSLQLTHRLSLRTSSELFFGVCRLLQQQYDEIDKSISIMLNPSLSTIKEESMINDTSNPNTSCESSVPLVDLDADDNIRLMWSQEATTIIERAPKSVDSYELDTPTCGISLRLSNNSEIEVVRRAQLNDDVQRIIEDFNTDEAQSPDLLKCTSPLRFMSPEAPSERGVCDVNVRNTMQYEKINFDYQNFTEIIQSDRFEMDQTTDFTTRPSLVARRIRKCLKRDKKTQLTHFYILRPLVTVHTHPEPKPIELKVTSGVLDNMSVANLKNVNGQIANNFRRSFKSKLQNIDSELFTANSMEIQNINESLNYQYITIRRKETICDDMSIPDTLQSSSNSAKSAPTTMFAFDPHMTSSPFVSHSDMELTDIVSHKSLPSQFGVHSLNILVPNNISSLKIENIKIKKGKQYHKIYSDIKGCGDEFSKMDVLQSLDYIWKRKKHLVSIDDIVKLTKANVSTKALAAKVMIALIELRRDRKIIMIADRMGRIVEILPGTSYKQHRFSPYSI